MIDELQLFDLVLAVAIVACSVIGLAIVTRPQRARPVTARALRRLNEQLDEQEQR